MLRTLLTALILLPLLQAGDAPTPPPASPPAGTPSKQSRELPPLPALPERCRRNAATGLDAGWDRACQGMGRCLRWGWRNGNGPGSTSGECDKIRDGQRCLRGAGRGPGPAGRGPGAGGGAGNGSAP